jgi:membrane protein implicated in regulation of membrane protease activity
MKAGTTVNPPLGEPDAHVMMRNAKTIFRVLLILTLITTTLLFLFFRQAAYVAALPVAVLFLGYVLASYLEKQSRAKSLRSTNPLTISKEEVEMNVQYAGIYTAMGLMLFFAIVTFVVAATMVEDWTLIGMVAAVLFLLSALIILPYISLFMSDAREDERDKLQQEAIDREGPKSE